jgi:hypothetical protein
MPVLMLALLSVILFIVTLVLLGFAEASEARKLRMVDALADGSPFRVLSVCDAFEPDYAVLWETQAPALRLVATAGTKGVTRPQLFAFYKRAASRYPELYDGSSFRQWLQFLEGAELISVRDSRITITPQGLQFLRFRVETKVAA